MTIPDILKGLETYTGKFPWKAMKAAVEQRDEIVPELLRVLEEVAAAPAEWAARKNYMTHVFAVHLLAQFRESRAYAPLIKIVSAPGEIPFDLFGDTITEGLGRLLATLYEGDLAPLYGLVENKEVNEFVRSAAIEALMVLWVNGRMSREALVDYFRALCHEKLERAPAYVWNSVATATADIPAPELLPEIRLAYAEGFTDPMVAGLAELERDIQAPHPKRHESRSLIDDAIAEMEWWASFHLDPPRRPVTTPSRSSEPSFLVPPSTADGEAPTPSPHIRGPKVGRNDPCPCGSAKKYKKCCGK